MSPLDVLSVMQDGIADYTESGHEGLASDMTEAHNAVAELIEAHRELLTDVSIAQANMRRAVAYDPKWEGCAEAIQPRVDAAKAALNRVSGGEA